MVASIPAGLAINEPMRLLAYLKATNQPGYIHKCDISRLCRTYGKDPRTINKYLKTLYKLGLIGLNEGTYFLRSWRFISLDQKFNSQAFKISAKQIRDKKTFEAKLLGAKVTSIQKAFRRGKSSSAVKGDARIKEQIPSGFLGGACNVSQGKVTQLKRMAVNMGFLKVERCFQDLGAGTTHSKNILSRELSGLFIRDGNIKRRLPDKLISSTQTFRIKKRTI